MTANSEEVTVIEDRKHYEMVTWEGKEARHYPNTGAVMVQDEFGRWIIRGNTGGRVDFDARAMVEAREIKKREAIINGLESAAYKLDLRTGFDVLSEIVSARAKNAITDEGRTGNADAKFIFSLVSETGEEGKEKPAIRIDMDRESANKLIQRLLEI